MFIRQMARKAELENMIAAEIWSLSSPTSEGTREGTRAHEMAMWNEMD